MDFTKWGLSGLCKNALLVRLNRKESRTCASGCCKDDTVVPIEKYQLGRGIRDGSIPTNFENEPLLCTLTGPELAKRKTELKKEVFSKIKKAEAIETGYIFSFEFDENFLLKMTDYVITETNCCPFFTFETTFHAKNDVLLKITGPPEAKQMLSSFLDEGEW